MQVAESYHLLAIGRTKTDDRTVVVSPAAGLVGIVSFLLARAKVISLKSRSAFELWLFVAIIAVSCW